MFEHPVLSAIRAEGFVALGWFEPGAEDGVPGRPAFLILIGNAGPHMFARFARERAGDGDTLDDWCRAVLDPLAEKLGARALYPFDTPPLPFSHLGTALGRGAPLAARAERPSRLRPLACLPRRVRISGGVRPSRPRSASPCLTCAAKPCLEACPVGAFDGKNLRGRGMHRSPGPRRRAPTAWPAAAWPAGPVRSAAPYTYDRPQAQFHMRAFLAARLAQREKIGGVHG